MADPTITQDTTNQRWVYSDIITNNSYVVVFNTLNKFLDANIRAELTVQGGEIVPKFSNTNLGTYFDEGSAANNSISIIPQATNTGGFISAHNNSSPVQGEAAYYTIKAGSGTTDSADVVLYTTDGSNAGENISRIVKTANISNTEPNTSGSYYLAFTGSGNSKINTTGWLTADTSLATTSITKYFPITKASISVSKVSGSISPSASLSKADSVTWSTSNTSGVWLKATGNGSVSNLKIKANVSTEGYIPPGDVATAENISIAAASTPATETKYITGVTINSGRSFTVTNSGTLTTSISGGTTTVTSTSTSAGDVNIAAKINNDDANNTSVSVIDDGKLVIKTISFGGQTLTNTNYTNNNVVVSFGNGSDTNMANTTYGSKDTTNYPYYFKITGSTPAIDTTTKVSIGAVTYSNDLGIVTAHNGATALSATSSSPTVKLTAGAGSTYLKMKEATMTVSGTNTVTPTAAVEGASGVVLTNDTNSGISITATGGGTASASVIATTNAAGYAPANTQLGSNTLSSGSSATTTTDTLYIYQINVPKANNFTVTTTANTSSSNDTSVLTVTNNAYRKVTLTNAANGTATVTNSGTVNTFTNNGTTTTFTNAGTVTTLTNNSSKTISTITNNGTIGTLTNKNTITTLANNSSKTISTLTNAGTITALNNSGIVTIKSTSTTAGTVNVNAYPASGSTLSGNKAIVSGGRWQCVPAFNGAGTYYGKVDLSGSTVTQGNSSVTNGVLTRGTLSWTAGYITANTGATVPIAVFSAEPSSGVDYLDISTYPDAPVLAASNGFLYINKGYTDNLKISLGRLIPDTYDNLTDIATDNHILKGYIAFDSSGHGLSGTIETYRGQFTKITS